MTQARQSTASSRLELKAAAPSAPLVPTSIWSIGCVVRDTPSPQESSSIPTLSAGAPMNACRARPSSTPRNLIGEACVADGKPNVEHSPISRASEPSKERNIAGETVKVRPTSAHRPSAGTQIHVPRLSSFFGSCPERCGEEGLWQSKFSIPVPPTSQRPRSANRSSHSGRPFSAHMRFGRPPGSEPLARSLSVQRPRPVTARSRKGVVATAVAAQASAYSSESSC